MKITSYNITDVGYHHIGIRVLGTENTNIPKQEQCDIIARSILKYARDKALRLLLPEPRGTFESIGEKVCYELVHFKIADSQKNSFALTDYGNYIFSLISNKKFSDLRKEMVCVHLKTYENLLSVLQSHWQQGSIIFPIVDTENSKDQAYLGKLINLTFATESSRFRNEILENILNKSAKFIEDYIREQILKMTLIDKSIRLPLYRSLLDRLNSLRLVNNKKQLDNELDSYESYSVISQVKNKFFPNQTIKFEDEYKKPYELYYPEPDYDNDSTFITLLNAILESFELLNNQAGYFSIPQVRDLVCQKLLISEGSFDEGLNKILDKKQTELTVALSYEGISGKRKPLYRSRLKQIYNLIKRY